MSREDMPDVFEDARRENETRAEAKARVFDEVRAIQPVTYDQVVELMSRLEREPYRDSWGHTPEEIKSMGLALHPLTQRPQAYHMRPKEFMQGMGGGKPYNLKSGIHFSMRYGMRAQPGIRVGVYHKTPRLMAEHEARESGARQALRLLGKPWQDRRVVIEWARH